MAARLAYAICAGGEAQRLVVALYGDDMGRWGSSMGTWPRLREVAALVKWEPPSEHAAVGDDGRAIGGVDV
jgi:hypothetical protein